MLNSRTLSTDLLRYLLPAGLFFAVVPLLAATETAEPWTKAQLVAPQTLKARLADSTKAKPLILCVGFKFLYDAGHVPGSEFYGPGTEARGIAALKKKLEPLPRGKEIVLYCGCCPFEQCPNIRPAFEAARKMGFIHLEVLDLPTSFVRDWAEKGFPVEKSD